MTNKKMLTRGLNAKWANEKRNERKRKCPNWGLVGNKEKKKNTFV